MPLIVILNVFRLGLAVFWFGALGALLTGWEPSNSLVGIAFATAGWLYLEVLFRSIAE